MQLHDLRAPKGSRKKKRIVGRGRGSGRGKTSGRGENGQGSRTGTGKVVRSSEGGQMPLIRRLPKVGFRSARPILNQIVTLSDLNEFKKDEVVNKESLKAKGLISSINKSFKILGNGEVKTAVTVEAMYVSKSAKEKIEKAGGKVEILPSKADIIKKDKRAAAKTVKAAKAAKKK